MYKKNIRKVISRCGRCGHCQSVCPLYALDKKESSVARGKITLAYLLVRGRLSFDRALAHELKYCLFCMACVRACKSHVDYTRILLWLRRQTFLRFSHPFLLLPLFKILETGGTVSDLAAGFARLVAPVFFQQVRVSKTVSGQEERVPLFFSRGRLLPSIAGEFFLQRYRRSLEEKKEVSGILTSCGCRSESSPEEKVPARKQSRDDVTPGESCTGPGNFLRRKKVLFFPGCLINYVAPEMGMAAVSRLLECGYEVDIPESHMCCGTPALVYGDFEAAGKLGKKIARNALRGGYDFIATACASCGSTLRHLSKYLGSESGLESCEELARLATMVRDVSELVWMRFHESGKTGSEYELSRERKNAESAKLHISREFPGKVMYHRACHLARAQNVVFEPLSILRAAYGDELIDSGDCGCCGGAGAFSYFFYESSIAILSERLKRAGEAGASAIVAGCPLCVIHFRDGARRAGLSLEVFHTVEVFRIDISR